MKTAVQRVVMRLMAAIVVLVVAAAVVYGLRPRAVLVETATIARGALDVVVLADGQTRVRERHVVSATVPGQLERIQLQPGDEVRQAETVVARIRPNSPPLLDARARAQAEARVKAAEAERRRAGAAREAAEISHEYAVSEHERARELLELRAELISQSDYDAAATLARVRAEELEAARLAEEAAAAELEAARAAVLPATEQPATTVVDILAPVTGRVLRVLQAQESAVLPGTPLVELGDPAALELRLDVLSSDAVRVTSGADVLITEWGGPEPLQGRVRLVEPTAFPRISPLGIEEQRVNVIVDLLSPVQHRRTLGDGFEVQARIRIWRGADVLRVPTSALFQHDGRWWVFQLHQARARRQPVTLGERNDAEAQVLTGLEPGDEVVLYPAERIRDGMRVVVEAARAP